MPSLSSPGGRPSARPPFFSSLKCFKCRSTEMHYTTDALCPVPVPTAVGSLLFQLSFCQKSRLARFASPAFLLLLPPSLAFDARGSTNRGGGGGGSKMAALGPCRCLRAAVACRASIRARHTHLVPSWRHSRPILVPLHQTLASSSNAFKTEVRRRRRQHNTQAGLFGLD